LEILFRCFTKIVWAVRAPGPHSAYRRQLLVSRKLVVFHLSDIKRRVNRTGLVNFLSDEYVLALVICLSNICLLVTVNILLDNELFN
jgi:hypothetical protein